MYYKIVYSLPNDRAFLSLLHLHHPLLFLCPTLLALSLLQEPVWKPDAYSAEEEQDKASPEFIDTKDEDELDELEDAFPDDRFLEEYRRRRIQELQLNSNARPRFGDLVTIRGSEFVAQVTNAGEGVWVVCHLFKDSVQDCGILNACLSDLAPRYPATKFVKIVSTDCIPGYPDENLPTVLLYRDTKCKHTLVGLGAFGGRSTSPDRVALAINSPVSLSTTLLAIMQP